MVILKKYTHYLFLPILVLIFLTLDSNVHASSKIEEPYFEITNLMLESQLFEENENEIISKIIQDTSNEMRIFIIDENPSYSYSQYKKYLRRVPRDSLRIFKSYLDILLITDSKGSVINYIKNQGLNSEKGSDTFMNSLGYLHKSTSSTVKLSEKLIVDMLKNSEIDDVETRYKHFLDELFIPFKKEESGIPKPFIYLISMVFMLPVAGIILQKGFKKSRNIKVNARLNNFKQENVYVYPFFEDVKENIGFVLRKILVGNVINSTDFNKIFLGHPEILINMNKYLSLLSEEEYKKLIEQINDRNSQNQGSYEKDFLELFREFILYIKGFEESVLKELTYKKSTLHLNTLLNCNADSNVFSFTNEFLLNNNISLETKCLLEKYIEKEGVIYYDFV